MRHIDIRDSAKLLSEVCDVEVEPCHQTLQGETFANRTTVTDDGAQLDFKANGFFDSRFSRMFVDVKVFDPYAKSCPKSIQISRVHQEAEIRQELPQLIMTLN